MARQQSVAQAGGFSRDSLLKRVFFTLGALVVVRIGGFVPLPGVDPETFSRVLPAALPMGPEAARRVSVFAIGLVPYVSACVIVYTVAGFWQYLRALRWSGADGRRRLNHYIRVVAIGVAAFQGFGLAGAFEGVPGLVPQPGLGFRIGVTVSLVAGTAFLMWLGEEISRRGIGDGVWLIFAAETIAGLPHAAVAVLQLDVTGRVPAWALPVGATAIVALAALVVLAERAVRIVPVAGGRSEPIRLRLNHSGILAPTLAASLLIVPLTIASLMGAGNQEITWLVSTLGRGQPLFMLVYAALIAFFVFFYAAAAFDPGTMAAATPGSPSPSAVLDTVLARVTALGALYLVVLCLVPELMVRLSLPFYVGGPSLLIAVLVAMDIIAQWQQAWRR